MTAENPHDLLALFGPGSTISPTHLKLMFVPTAAQLNHLPSSIRHINFSKMARHSLTRTIISDHLRVLAEQCPHIHTMKLAWKRLSTNALTELTKFRQLTTLNLTGSLINDEKATQLASLTNLSTLDLTSNPIGDEGLTVLATLRNLTMLRLRNNAQISAVHLEAIRTAYNTLRIDTGRVLYALPLA
ncbi:hypothetical protein ACI0FO_21445 [Achromobacter marplatensis]